MNRRFFPLFVLLGSLPAPAWSQQPLDWRAASHLRQVDAYTLVDDQNLVSGYAPISSAGLVRVVIEIPAGTNAKWEVSKTTGHLKWESKNDKPRVVQYLAYPGNYGMVPRTILPKDLGGDGDPLDVFVLGPAVPRGAVVEARIIGVLVLLDGGEQDDKLIAVMPGNPLGEVGSLTELDHSYPGVSAIVETWFSNYKGAGVMESRGFKPADAAREILRRAMDCYATDSAQ